MAAERVIDRVFNKENDVTMIGWTRPMYDRFRKAYAVAVKAGHESFVFDGNEFVTSYAKYLLEWLTTEFERRAP